MLHWTFLWRPHNPDSVSQSPGANLVAGQIFQIWAGRQNNWKRLFPSIAVCGHWGGVIWWENMKNSISLRTHHTFTINPSIKGNIYAQKIPIILLLTLLLEWHILLYIPIYVYCNMVYWLQRYGFMYFAARSGSVRVASWIP